MSATAPEGGCTHLNTNIAPIDMATAIGAASIGFVIQVAHATPIAAETILPPMIDHGCASGLAGTAALVSSGLFGAPNGAPNSPPKRIALTNLHTGERVDVEYFRDDAYVPQAMASIEMLLRDFRSGEKHAIDPKLMDYPMDVATVGGESPHSPDGAALRYSNSACWRSAPSSTFPAGDTGSESRKKTRCGFW